MALVGLLSYIGALAQLVEQQPCKLCVTGSIPVCTIQCIDRRSYSSGGGQAHGASRGMVGSSPTLRHTK